MPLTTVDQGLLSTNAQYTGFKNRIINGDMVIDQRNNGATLTGLFNSGTFFVDRFRTGGNNFASGRYSISQPSDAPAGFAKSAKIDITTTQTTTTFWTITQSIEGNNTADFNLGTANASAFTLSFWVKGSTTGMYSLSLQNTDTTRSYVTTYTINSANTWEFKAITIPGPTSGTWSTGTSRSIRIDWLLNNDPSLVTASPNTWLNGEFNSVAGSVNLMAVSGGTWSITGVQLEKGQTATSFDVLPYGTELALCQRYCVKFGGDSIYEHLALGMGYSSAGVQAHIYLPVPMRALPSATISGNWVVQDGVVNTNITSFGFASSGAENSTKIVAMFALTAGGITQFRPYMIMANNSTASSYILSAEF